MIPTIWLVIVDSGFILNRESSALSLQQIAGDFWVYSLIHFNIKIFRRLEARMTDNWEFECPQYVDFCHLDEQLDDKADTWFGKFELQNQMNFNWTTSNSSGLVFGDNLLVLSQLHAAYVKWSLEIQISLNSTNSNNRKKKFI